MNEILNLALSVKEYVGENGRTLALSKGKMLSDQESLSERVLDKQTA